LQNALNPLLAEVESVSQRILEYDEQIENIGKSRYPEIELLKQITLLSMVNAQS
jgi:transposase